MVFDIFALNTPQICIDIGCRNIKVAQIMKKGSSILIEKFGIIDTPDGCLQNGAIINMDHIIKAIDTVISTNKMDARKSRIIVSATNVVARIYDIDKNKNETLDRTVYNKIIPNNLPIKIQDYKVDYKLLDTYSVGSEEKCKIFVTAVPKVSLQSYISVLSGLGMTPVSLDIPANCIYKFFCKNTDIVNVSSVNKAPKENDIYAVIDFGSETTTINVFNKNNLEYNRVIQYGGNNIDSMIANHLQISSRQAEILKIKYGMTMPNEDSPKEHFMVYDTICTCTEDIIKQISSCMDLFLRKFDIRSLNSVIPIGGASLLKGLEELLKSSLKTRVQSVSHINHTGIRLKNGVGQENLPYMVNCIGVSM